MIEFLFSPDKAFRARRAWRQVGGVGPYEVCEGAVGEKEYGTGQFSNPYSLAIATRRLMAGWL
jgi:hypothetical protein